MSEKELTLYHYWRSSCSWRVRWSLEYKNIAYKSKHLNLLKKEHKSYDFLRQNPLGLVPCLKIGKSFYLNESMAILEWLEEAFNKKKLLPENIEEKSLIREASYLITSTLQPLQNLQTIQHLSKEKDTQKKWARYWILLGLEAFEKKIRPYSGSYCFGDSLSFADLCLIPQVYNAHRFEIDMTEFSLLQKIYESSLRLNSCIMSHPSKFEPKE